MFIKENPQQFQEQLWLFMVCLNWCFISKYLSSLCLLINF
jgi:hypothetical protein